MKKAMLTIIASAAIILNLHSVNAQEKLKLPPPSSSQTIIQGLGISNVTLQYSRPDMKGRKIFGGLVPFGEVWRTGANTNTTLTFEHEVEISGQKLASGTYALFSIPGLKEWTIILSKNSKQWGAYTYKKEEDAARFTVKPETLPAAVETFTISFDNVTDQSLQIALLWDKTKVKFPVKVNQEQEISASIASVMGSTSDKKPYFQAAQYYFTHDLGLTKALEWFDEAEKAQPKAPHVLYWKAKAQLKAGHKKDAIITATKGLTAAKEANNNEYVKLNTEVIREAKK